MSGATSKSDNLRYSIIPARAITDPEITAQALRVLALLGRHSDDNGWSKRSQVKMAKELGCSRGTVQNALGLLIGPINGEGYVERREETRPGVEFKDGRRPHCSFSYRVRLDLGDRKRASLLAPPANPLARGANPDQHGVPISLAPNEHTPCEHTPCEQTHSAGAREDAVAAEEQPKPKPGKTVFEDRIWPEFRKCPGFSPNMAKASARAAFERVEDPPPTAQMIEAIRAYGRWLKAENAKRRANDPHPMAHPVTWLHQRRWEAFLDGGSAPDEADMAAALDVIRTRFGAFAEPLITALGAAVASAWLRDAEFLPGPPPILTVARAMQRNWLTQQLGAKLRRVFGADFIVELKRSRAA